MPEGIEIFSRLFDLSVSLGLLAVVVYFLYKERKRSEAKIEALQKEKDAAIEKLQKEKEEKDLYMINFLKDREADVIKVLETLEAKMTRKDDDNRR